MMSDPFRRKGDFGDFLHDVGMVAAGAKVYSDGVQYVDRAEFWHWLTSDVVKQPIVGDSPLPLNSAQAVQEWVSARIVEGKERFIRHILETRGAEFDFVRASQDNPIELLKGNLWRKATEVEDRTSGIDAVKTNIFTGNEETHQIKAGLSDSFKRVDLTQYKPKLDKNNIARLARDGKQHTPADVVDVNQSIGDWRNSASGRKAIEARGDTHPEVRKSFHNGRIQEQTDKRLEEVHNGQAEPGISLSGALSEVGRGALVGAVIGVGISGVTNYGKYKDGLISGAEFGDALIADSTRGALTGGTMAAVNIPVQLAAHAIGVGAPVTIPVMIVIGYGLNKIIKPMFGKGEYEEIIRSMNYTTDLTKGFATFSEMAAETYRIQNYFIDEVARLGARASVLDRISKMADETIEEALREI